MRNIIFTWILIRITGTFMTFQLGEELNLKRNVVTPNLIATI